VKSLWSRIVAWYRMEPEKAPAVEQERVAMPPMAASAAYIDLGVEDTMTGNSPTYMLRVYRKIRKGAYRFDGDTGTYHFSKQDAGREVVLFFIDHGQPRRLVHTIGL
jgi:hypothetical protein